MPTTLKMTQDDIDGLAKKLDEFAAVLTDRERAILLGILKMAGKEIGEVAAQAQNPKPPASLPPLSQGFHDAFQQGAGTTFTFSEGSEAERYEVEVSGGVSWSK